MHDVTSCLYLERNELKNCLSASSKPAVFDDARARLFVVDEGQTWVVDERGVVRHDGKEKALDNASFKGLLALLLDGLPQNGPSVLARKEASFQPIARP